MSERVRLVTMALPEDVATDFIPDGTLCCVEVVPIWSDAAVFARRGYAAGLAVARALASERLVEGK